MVQGSGDEWFYNAEFEDIGNYTYTIWTVDTNGNWNRSDTQTFTIQPPEIPKKPSRLPYMILLIIFWPLFLILFTIALVKRYGFGNRLKREIDFVVSQMTDYKVAHPGASLKAPDKNLGLAPLCQGTGIPLEEFMVTGLSLKGVPQIWDAGFNISNEGLVLNKELNKQFMENRRQVNRRR
jgi:hypothetical protein